MHRIHQASLSALIVICLMVANVASANFSAKLCLSAYSVDGAALRPTAEEEEAKIASYLHFSEGQQQSLRFFGRTEIQFADIDAISGVYRVFTFTNRASSKTQKLVERLQKIGGFKAIGQVYEVKRSPGLLGANSKYGGVESCDVVRGQTERLFSIPPSALVSEKTLNRFLIDHINKTKTRVKTEREQLRYLNEQRVQTLPAEVQAPLRDSFDRHGVRTLFDDVTIPTASGQARDNSVLISHSKEANPSVAFHEITHTTSFRSLHSSSGLAAIGRMIMFSSGLSMLATSGRTSYHDGYRADELEARLREMGLSRKSSDLSMVEQIRSAASIFTIDEFKALEAVKNDLQQSIAKVRSVSFDKFVDTFSVECENYDPRDFGVKTRIEVPIPKETYQRSGLDIRTFILRVIDARMAYLKTRPDLRVAKPKNERL